VPALLSWRLQRLRSQWAQSDWHGSELDANLPVVEADVMTVDDLPHPVAAHLAFQLLGTRLAWVDTTVGKRKEKREQAGLNQALEEVCPSLAKQLPVL
jgi:hypothetical protein